MTKEIYLDAISPFPRFMHRLHLSPESRYPTVAPLDARLFLCTDGCGSITVDGVPLAVRKGTLLLLPSGTPYRIETPDAPLEYLALNFDYTRAASDKKTPIRPLPIEVYRPEDLVAPVRFADELLLNSPLLLDGMQRLEAPLTRLLRILDRKVIYYECEASALTVEILLECVRAKRLTAGTHRRASLDHVLDYLHAHYAEPLTNKTVAEALGYHPVYINELVKRATGLPLHRYLLTVRLSRAVDLLEEGVLSIGEIAEACGFYDIYHFSRIFKREMGTAPTRYRQGAGSPMPPTL